MTRLDLADVQGGILHGYGFDHSAYVFLLAHTQAAARALLGRLLPLVTTAERWRRGAHPRTALNVAVTHRGLARLGTPPAVLDGFGAAFRLGPRERAAGIGDSGASAPEHWVPALGSGRVHLLVTLAAADAGELTAARAQLQDVLDADEALAVVHEQRARGLRNRREHFGYADGFAQPDVEGAPGRRRPGGGVPLADGSWRPLRTGEFLLGHRDEDGQVVTEPDPALVQNGSYVVYRKLYQDVAGFRRALAETAAATALPVELLAAKLVGRWRDGRPLLTDPDRPHADRLDREAEAAPSNDFRYLPADEHGVVCPVGAHIRRTNPRDALGVGGRLTARHRLLRRGMPYGPELPEGADDDRRDRGLVFVCYQADIERQFETVQSEWCNDGDAFGLGEDRDHLIGAAGGSGKLSIPVPGQPPLIVRADSPLVHTRGAEYLLAPGLEALRRLAAGRL